MKVREARERFAETMDALSAARLVRRHPRRTAGAAALLGALTGRAARHPASGHVVSLLSLVARYL